MDNENGGYILKVIVTPAPTKFSQEYPIGRDFLGQQSIVQYMANRCLPSFTNATRVLRYYSFWAWAFKMSAENFSKFKNEKDRWFYLMKLETALIICNKIRNPEMIGMPGIQGIPINVDNLKDFKDNDLIDIYSVKNRATSYSAVQYSPSLGT